MEPLHHVSGNWVAGGGGTSASNSFGRVLSLCYAQGGGGEHMISGAGGGSKGRFLEF